MIMERTANHPFLLQLIASRLFESRDLAATLDQVAADEMVSNFFSVDFQTLDADERAVAGGGGARGGRAAGASWPRPLGRAEEAVEPLLFGLRMMGYLAADGGALPRRQLVLRALAAAGGRGAGRARP